MVRKPSRPEIGILTEKKGAWYWRHYTGETRASKTGKIERVQKWERICDVSDEYRTKSDVVPLINARIKQESPDRPASGNILIVNYVTGTFLPYLESNVNGKRSPATINGYKKIWNAHLREHFGKLALRDYKPHHATRFLDSLAPNMTTASLQHVRAVMSLIFKHAVQDGRIDTNPIRDSGVRVGTKPSEETPHYTLEEMRGILAALIGQERVIMTLAFLGVRPAEMAGLRWEDVRPDGLDIQRGLWGKHITKGKTGPRFVPAGPFVMNILGEHKSSREFFSGHVLENGASRPLSTHGIHAAVARTIRPVLDKLGFEWKQLYGGRRGAITEMRRHADPQTVAFVMGHSPEVENAHYLKAVEADKQRVSLTFDSALSAPVREQ